MEGTKKTFKWDDVGYNEILKSSFAEKLIIGSRGKYIILRAST